MSNKFDNDFIQYSDKKVKEENKNLALYLSLTITLYIIVFFFAVFFTWYTVFVSTHKYYEVSGASMKPTYNESISDTDQNSKIDAVYVNTSDPINVFDVVVIKRKNKDAIIKRVIAQAGDYVTIATGIYDGNPCFYVYRISAEEMSSLDVTVFEDESAKLVENGENGYQINTYSNWFANSSVVGNYESSFYNVFLSPEVESNFEYFTSKDGLRYVKVPENKVFCLGDNRGHSGDSRVSGFYDVSNLVGRVEFVVYNHNFVNRLWEVVKFYFSEAEKFFAR